MKTLLLALLLTGGAQAAPVFCSLKHSKTLYKDIADLPINDKAKHCALSCQLALKCPSYDVWQIGFLKEVYDLFTPGRAEWEDLAADEQGIKLATSNRARTNAECLKECKAIYP